MARTKPTRLAEVPITEQERADAATPPPTPRTAAQEEKHLANRKRAEQRKKAKNLIKNLEPESDGVKMRFFRKWMRNELNKIDRGEMDQSVYEALAAWSEAEPEDRHLIVLAQEEEAIRDQFLAEWEAAAKVQERNNGLVKWWVDVPINVDRIEEDNGAKEFWKLMKEERTLAKKAAAMSMAKSKGKDKELPSSLLDAKNVIGNPSGKALRSRPAGAGKDEDDI
ncbi:MAG: hypothetical protein Q9169_005694 [Polycauliona sp. 2 TL-2023]